MSTSECHIEISGRTRGAYEQHIIKAGSADPRNAGQKKATLKVPSPVTTPVRFEQTARWLPRKIVITCTPAHRIHALKSHCDEESVSKHDVSTNS